MKCYELISFLNKLENAEIYYKLNKIRDSILIEIAVPGQRWEVEFMDDDTIEIEKFISDGNYYDANELKNLFNDFSN